MGIRGILRFSGGALLFAAAVCGLWLAARRLTGRGTRPVEMLAVAYLAALIQITALRIGLRGHAWLGGAVCLAPLKTTLEAWRDGAWPFIYHIVGNMIWFVSLGVLLPALFPRANARTALLAGAALSLGIEVVQYLLGTGVSDIDDTMLNALGALTGYGLQWLFRQRLSHF